MVLWCESGNVGILVAERGFKANGLIVSRGSFLRVTLLEENAGDIQVDLPVGGIFSSACV